jgi:hypothetical protein
MIMGIVNRQPRLGGGLRRTTVYPTPPLPTSDRHPAPLRFCDSLTKLSYARRRHFYPIY